MIMDITRREAQFLVQFKQSCMELHGIYRGQVELELRVDLFPLSFYESLSRAVNEGCSTQPRIGLGFGKRQHFSLERQGGLKNDEMWFTLKTTTPGFFVIELREQEIRNLLANMRGYMTR